MDESLKLSTLVCNKPIQPQRRYMMNTRSSMCKTRSYSQQQTNTAKINLIHTKDYEQTYKDVVQHKSILKKNYYYLPSQYLQGGWFAKADPFGDKKSIVQLYKEAAASTKPKIK